MSAPILTISEQKAAISGKKKKKKTLKNVLNIPGNQKAKSFFVEAEEAKKLNQILERLLPNARLPAQQYDKNREDSNKYLTKELDSVAEARNKRNQLSIGINSVNRSIKKGLISSVLFACDIQPRFLIQHLNLLCNHYKIPFLHIPNLREVTKNNLGFPCIALGFKKDFFDFSQAVEEIQSILQSKKIISNEKSLEIVNESSDSDEKEIVSNNVHENMKRSDESQFTYLYRTSINERVFIPENIYENQPPKETNIDFLKIENDDAEFKSKSHPSLLGISNKFRKQVEKLKKLELGNSESDDDNDGDLEVPRKKIKKDWVIDKIGRRTKVKYYPANLMRVPSNPSRMKKKKQ